MHMNMNTVVIVLFVDVFQVSFNFLLAIRSHHIQVRI